MNLNSSFFCCCCCCCFVSFFVFYYYNASILARSRSSVEQPVPDPSHAVTTTTRSRKVETGRGCWAGRQGILPPSIEYPTHIYLLANQYKKTTTTKKPAYLVGWCFQPSQPQRITLGLNTNFILSPSYSFHKSLHHTTHMFLSLFIFRAHSTREPASSKVTYFILWAYTGTSISRS